jgi:hypothetical protein
MKILFAGILGGIAMFIWTSIAHLVLPLGEAGIQEIPNESVVLSAMQSNIGDQTGLYIFPGLGVGKNATRQEKNEAMKQIARKAASGPSGLLMYHPTRPFTFGKWMGIEFGTELLEAILVVFLLSQTRIASFIGRVQRFLLELVWFPGYLRRQLHAYPDRWLLRCGNRRSAAVAKACRRSIKTDH